MQDIVDFRSELEETLSWRMLEYLSLKNLLDADEHVPMIKALIVMLYAHFEGFFKDCLEIYINYINSSDKQLYEFNDSLIAAALSREYGMFENINRRCKILTSDPPVENFLHRFHRRKELTRIFTSSFLLNQIRIDEKIINTQSNLDYGVMQENLYILGLDYNYFESQKDFINRLVNLRNSVAHGSQKGPINPIELEKIEKTIFEVMTEIITYLYEFCYENKYLKTNNNVIG